MLNRLLSRIRAGGAWTVEGLAAEWGVTPTLIEAMLDDLVRRGYLVPVQGLCDKGCASCGMAGNCDQPDGQRMWRLSSANG